MTVSRHIRQLQQALMDAQPALDTAGHWGRVLADLLPNGRRLLVGGNGGSAAQAQHLTAEMVGRYQDERQPFSALALHAETSSLTAIANDYGVEEMFARPVRAHGRPGDVCLLMSTSGRSRNLLAAAHAASENGLQVWAMTGPGPNTLADLADDALYIDAPDTCTVQELHLVAVHELCAQFDAALHSATLMEARR
jgi:D-sedoheptulose 7-phosphate isomerase